MNRLIFRSLIIAFVIIALFCVPSIASADGIETWNLSGVTFNDGGTASGSFTYDATANAFSAIDIITTAGSAFPGATYKSLSGLFGSTSTGMALGASSGDLTGTAMMLLYFSNPLKDAGGPDLLITGATDGGVEGTCNNLDCSDSTAFRFIKGGELVGTPVSTPELSALSLLSIGLVALLTGVAIRKVSHI